MDQVHGLMFDGLGLQLLDCCAELSINFVNALGPLEVKHRQLFDNAVSGGRWHFFDFVTFVYFVPQPAIDLRQMRENRANTSRDLGNSVTFSSINLVGGKSQPLDRNATA